MKQIWEEKKIDDICIFQATFEHKEYLIGFLNFFFLDFKKKKLKKKKKKENILKMAFESEQLELERSNVEKGVEGVLNDYNKGVYLIAKEGLKK